MAEAGDLRASDEERDTAARAIREHFAAGRLSDEELADRLSAIYRAQTAGELTALGRDLPALPPTAAETKAELVARRSQLQRRMLQEAGGGLTPFVVCTVIWLASGATGFFWPIILLLVVVLPLIRNGWALYGPAPELEHVERQLERRARERHSERDRHAEHHARSVTPHLEHDERHAARRAQRRERRRER